MQLAEPTDLRREAAQNRPASDPADLCTHNQPVKAPAISMPGSGHCFLAEEQKKQLLFLCPGPRRRLLYTWDQYYYASNVLRGGADRRRHLPRARAVLHAAVDLRLRRAARARPAPCPVTLLTITSPLSNNLCAWMLPSTSTTPGAGWTGRLLKKNSTQRSIEPLDAA